MKKVGVIKMYPTYEGKEYPMEMEFYDDGTVKLNASKETPQHLIQEASGYIIEGMFTLIRKEEKENEKA